MIRRGDGREKVKTLLKTYSKYIGWLLLLAGLVLPGMEAFDSLTCQSATARIVSIGESCEQKQQFAGRTSWRRFSCEKWQDAIASGVRVKKVNHAKLSFATTKGPATAWARFSKLELRQAKVGDTLPILYRGEGTVYVTTPFSLENVSMGLMISLVGLMMLIATSERVAFARKPAHDVASDTRQIASNPGQTAATRLVTNKVVTTPSNGGRPGAVQRNKSWL